MSFRLRPATDARAPFAPGATRSLALGAAALLALGATALRAQYSTPVGKGAAKPKTLRATAVLEWTGPLDKPNASRLMPVAVWDGEHYQPAGLYLARPDPLALESGTQYQLERAGDPVGLYNIRAAAEINGSWEGIGRFQAEAPPPPPPRLKPSRHLPVLSNGKPDTAAKPGAADSGASSASDRPTLHRKTGESAPSPASSSSQAPASGTTGTASAAGSSGAATTSQSSTSPSSTSQSSTGQPAATSPATPASGSSTASSSDSSQPTLHRRTSDSDSNGSGTSTNSTTSTASGSSTGTGSSSTGSNAPTLHRRDDSTANDSSADASKTSPDADTDRPTLHKHSDTASSGDEDDRPTLHRVPSSSAAAAAIDPDRPRLRYGAPDDSSEVILPTRLKGMPADMQQVVAVSDSGPLDPRPYQYHWPSPSDAAKMQAAMAALAEQAIAKPNPPGARPAAQFGPAARASARKAKQGPAKSTPQPTLVDARFAAYELTFSGGATLVYTAHTADPGPQRVYVTLIAQPDFSGNPQVLLQQVAHGDRLDETPAMQLVDAVDTDGDQRAELIFQLTGASMLPPPDSTTAAPAYDGPGDANAVNDAAAANAAAAAARAQAAAAVPEREFAIYRVANGKAVQVFDTGPLP